MGECSCWSVGTWVSLALAVVSSTLFVVATVRLGATRRRMLHLARERDVSREALLDATVRREVAEAEQGEALASTDHGPLDIRLLAETEVRRAARYGRALSLILVRLPHECPPDHPAWEHLAELLRRHLRDSDHAGRFDAASSLVVLTETERVRAEEVASRVRTELAREPDGAVAGARFAVDALTAADASAEAILGRLRQAVDEAAPPPDLPPPT
jgi:hypothetical protein